MNLFVFSNSWSYNIKVISCVIRTNKCAVHPAHSCTLHFSNLFFCRGVKIGAVVRGELECVCLWKGFVLSLKGLGPPPHPKAVWSSCPPVISLVWGRGWEHVRGQPPLLQRPEPTHLSNNIHQKPIDACKSSLRIQQQPLTPVKWAGLTRHRHWLMLVCLV